jgi:hypothetical protein
MANGKGSKPRKVDGPKYRDNFDNHQVGQEARNKEIQMNLKKLLAKGHLIPIYNPVGDNLCLVGYRRKPTSRKASQRPFLLKQPIVLGPLTPNPETE